MPRGPRLDGPGLLHHVRARGVERRKIFLRDEDRENFLERLALVCEGGSAFVYAWALMSNHFHLAIRTGSQSISRTMKRLLSGYATSFNLRNNRDGYVFQNRFKSTVVDEERYFLGLVRYIHMNPVRARIVAQVSDMKNYPWAGHSALMGKVKRKWQDTDEVLSRFGKKTGAARRELVAFMESADEKRERKTFKGGGLVRSAGGLGELLGTGQKEKWAFDERVLGSGHFVEAVLERYEKAELRPIYNDVQRHEKLKIVIARVSELSGFTHAELTGAGRRRELVKYKGIVVFIAVRHLGFSAARIGRGMSLSPTSALKAVTRGEEALNQLELTLTLQTPLKI